MIAAMAVMVAATSCERTIFDREMDVPKIEFLEQTMTVPAEGGEFYIPVNSTGIDHASISADSNWVRDENGDLLPIDEWIEVVKVIEHYDGDAESTRALASWTSAIVIKVAPNETGYSRSATLSARSFSVSDSIVIYQ